MILTIAAVSAGITLLVEAAKYVVKKTKTKKDDEVVQFIDKNKDAIIGFVLSKVSGSDEKAASPRDKVVDHRTGNK